MHRRDVEGNKELKQADIVLVTCKQPIVAASGVDWLLFGAFGFRNAGLSWGLILVIWWGTQALVLLSNTI